MNLHTLLQRLASKMRRCLIPSGLLGNKDALLGTNISHPKTVGKMSLISHWWDMASFPWMVFTESLHKCVLCLFQKAPSLDLREVKASSPNKGAVVWSFYGFLLDSLSSEIMCNINHWTLHLQ